MIDYLKSERFFYNIERIENCSNFFLSIQFRIANPIYVLICSKKNIFLTIYFKIFIKIYFFSESWFYFLPCLDFLVFLIDQIFKIDNGKKFLSEENWYLFWMFRFWEKTKEFFNEIFLRKFKTSTICQIYQRQKL